MLRGCVCVCVSLSSVASEVCHEQISIFCQDVVIEDTEASLRKHCDMTTHLMSSKRAQCLSLHQIIVMLRSDEAIANLSCSLKCTSISNRRFFSPLPGCDTLSYGWQQKNMGKEQKSYEDDLNFNAGEKPIKGWKRKMSDTSRCRLVYGFYYKTEAWDFNEMSHRQLVYYVFRNKKLVFSIFCDDAKADYGWVIKLSHLRFCLPKIDNNFWC